MTIENIKIYVSDYSNKIVCRATLTSKNWKYCNNVIYWCDLNKWLSDHYTLPDSQKKMCRHEWYKLAKILGISRKELNITI